MKVLLFSLITCIITYSPLLSQDKITFPSKDGLSITADLYAPQPSTSPFIVLFHQAGWSRGAYLEIAPKLNEMGFNCLAVDLRSGGEINGIRNETNLAAISAGKATEFFDAYQDIEAAVDYAKVNHALDKTIIWGSSYSSSLVLRFAGENTNKINGVLSFSPGEYFTGKSKSFIATSAKNISVPVFITSAKSEYGSWKDIFKVISSDQKSSFLPKTAGNHGSRALWSKFDDSHGYWHAMTSFLGQFL